MVVNYKPRLIGPRATVVVTMSVYFVTLAAMAIYLMSSRTMLLTPRDPLLWSAAKMAFLATSGPVFIWYVRTVSRISGVSRRGAIWFLGRVMGPGLFFAAMMGIWAYLAANVYVTANTWGAHIDHGAVLMAVEGPVITHRGRPMVEAHLLDRPGRDVFFTIDEADAQLLRRSHDAGYIDEPACLTVPVQWSGYAIRAEVTMNQPLPKGRVSTCS
jgi:hypothetical protein